MNLRAERRERIAEFISCKRQTTIESIFYALQGTDYETSRRTIRRDVEYLMYEKNYGINTKHGGCSCIYAESSWFYSRPVTSKDILIFQQAIVYLPDDFKQQYEEALKHVIRMKEY